METAGRAYSYVRFSSERQALGDSVRRQVKLAEEYAAQHGLELDTHSYRDLGVSAFRGRNAVEGKLGTFLQAVDAGYIKKGSYLLVESLDRLSRAQVDEALELFLSITRRGISIVTLMDGNVYSQAQIKQDKGISLIVSILGMVRAHEESETKSRRVAAAWAANRQNWQPGDKLISRRGPSWVTPNAGGTGWDLVPDKVKIVQRIFELSTRVGQTAIVRTLNEEGVPTMDDAKSWSQSIIGSLLRSRSAMGQYVQVRGGDRIIEGYFPEIVTKKRWLQAHDATRSRRTTGGTKSGKTGNLFSALSRCLYCGSATRYVETNKGHRYIHCLDAYGRGGCTARPFPYKAAETAILDRLMNAQLNLMDNNVDEEDDERVALIRAEIDDLEGKINRLIDTQMGLTSATAVERLTAKLNDWGAQVDELKRQLLTADAPVPDMSDRLDAMNLFRKHLDMVEAKDPAVIDMRRTMQLALRRQLRKIEFGPEFQESEIWAIQGAKFLRGKLSRFKVGDSPNFIVQLTFASGKVRIVDADPFINARSIAARTVAKKKAATGSSLFSVKPKILK